MNENYTEFKFPHIKPTPWDKVFEGINVPPLAIDLLSKLLVYSPVERYNAFEACSHPYFDALRSPDCKLPDQSPLPELFDFSKEEVANMGPELAKKLIPEHVNLPFNVQDCFNDEDI